MAGLLARLHSADAFLETCTRSPRAVVEIVVLPLSLLEAFHRTKDPCQDWGHLLRFLSPLSVPSNPLIKMM
jgi:hypothetical protein